MKKSLLGTLLVAATLTASAQNKEKDNNTNPIVPVLKSYVPPDVVERAIKIYGRELYCITQVKGSNGSTGYVVGLIRNGRLTNEYMEVLKIA